MNDNYCKDWNPFIEKGVNPKVLLIGHDPRLQSSDTIANYALFSDYYFDDKPKKGSEKKKFDFATISPSVFYWVGCAAGNALLEFRKFVFLHFN